jgi:hypothetical protein
MAKRMAAENLIWSKAANEAGLIEKDWRSEAFARSG